MTEYEFADDNVHQVMLPLPVSRIKKELPKPPAEDKDDLGRCLCGDRMEDAFRKLESQLQTQEEDGGLHLTKDQLDLLLEQVSSLVSI